MMQVVHMVLSFVIDLVLFDLVLSSRHTVRACLVCYNRCCNGVVIHL